MKKTYRKFALEIVSRSAEALRDICRNSRSTAKDHFQDLLNVYSQCGNLHHSDRNDYIWVRIWFYFSIEFWRESFSFCEEIFHKVAFQRTFFSRKSRFFQKYTRERFMVDTVQILSHRNITKQFFGVTCTNQIFFLNLFLTVSTYFFSIHKITCDYTANENLKCAEPEE